MEVSRTLRIELNPWLTSLRTVSAQEFPMCQTYLHTRAHTPTPLPSLLSRWLCWAQQEESGVPAPKHLVLRVSIVCWSEGQRWAAGGHAFLKSPHSLQATRQAWNEGDAWPACGSMYCGGQAVP